MDTKKVVVTLYGENHISYVGDIVVEAPQGMAEEVIGEVIMSQFHRIPEPQWREEEEQGFSINDDSPATVYVTASDEEPSVRLTGDKDGGIRVFIRKKHVC